MPMRIFYGGREGGDKLSRSVGCTMQIYLLFVNATTGKVNKAKTRQFTLNRTVPNPSIRQEPAHNMPA